MRQCRYPLEVVAQNQIHLFLGIGITAEQFFNVMIQIAWSSSATQAILTLH